MNGVTGTSTGQINNLHLIRMIAAFLVVYYHSGYRLFGLQSFGGFSVPIFFIISGFMMAMLATEHPQQFLKRRLLRIIPAYWVVTFIIFGISALVPAWFHSTRPNIVWLLKSLFCIPFEKAPGIIQPVVFVGWTINCEIILYLIVAWAIRYTKKPILFSSAAILLFMALASCFAQESAIGFFYSRSTMLSFVLGFAAYFVWQRLTRPSCRKARWYAYATLISLTCGLCVLEGRMIAPYITADSMYSLRPLIPQLGSFVIVISALLLTKAGDDLPGRAVALGAEATYLVYLMHAYILLALSKLAKHLPSSFAIDHVAGLTIGVGLSFAIAIYLHRFVEKPGINWLRGFVAGHHPVSRTIQPITQPRSQAVPVDYTSTEAAV